MANQTVHDPVCHMDITVASAAGSSHYEGQTYYFCAIGCKRDFDEDPVSVLRAEAAYDHAQPLEHGMAVAAGQKKPWWQFWKS